MPKLRRLTVLNVATLNRPIKKDLAYAPIESVIYNIDRGLHALGHRSIVACPADSKVSGRKFATIAKGFTQYFSESHSAASDMERHLALSLKRARRGDIDILHMHDAAMVESHFKALAAEPVPIVMTLHVPSDDRAPFGRWGRSLVPASRVYFVPISEYQRRQHGGLMNLQSVVHHGVDVADYPHRRSRGLKDYLFSIGRITADKGQAQAIQVARRTGSRLILAGNVQNKAQDRAYFARLCREVDLITMAGKVPADRDYVRTVMQPILDSGKQVIYIGELDSDQKKLWYLHATATLFPIQWREPFGLVLIESMACGTPVIAFNKGSVPEIVVDGRTGYVVKNVEQMVRAVRKVGRVRRADCRRHIRTHFSIAAMTAKYVALYRRILA